LNCVSLCLVCCLAGVMYWSDYFMNKIEMSYINGTGRAILLDDGITQCAAASHYDGYVYFTDDQRA